MTLLYYHPRMLDHETGSHPERAERLEQVIGRLDRSGLAQRCARPAWAAASDERVTRVHTPGHLAALRGLAARGGGRAEVDTVVSRDSPEVAALAAGAACDAVERVVAGEDKTALCLVRPPGHHALADAPMGFCLVGNVAVAARVAVDELGLDRVLVIDWDVHHGNGTQAMFYHDPRVAFLSIHRWPFYPGTGSADETGAGDGLGLTRNLPVAWGTPRRKTLEAFAAELADFADRVRPQLVLVSAGFDAHREDPVGSLGWETEDFAHLTRLVRGVADAHAAGRVVSVLEGGYNPPVLADCVATHLEELLESRGG